MKSLKDKIMYIIFSTNTEFTELLLGGISLLTGLWLICPSCSEFLNSCNAPSYLVPKLWGIGLALAGILKLIGVLSSKIKLRVLSAFIATIVWTVLTMSWLFLHDPYLKAMFYLSIPITAVLAVFNILIYTKLQVVRSNGLR